MCVGLRFLITVFLLFHISVILLYLFNFNKTTVRLSSRVHLPQITATVETASTSHTKLIHDNKTQPLVNVTSQEVHNDNNNDNDDVQSLVNTSSQAECTYDKDFTVYMDAFKKVTDFFFQEQYQEFLMKSQECGPMPGGGHCIFNHDNELSDAIFYYGGVTDLNFKRVFNDQIVVVFTMEAESGPNCHLPPPDKYDIKISYKRDSTVPKPFLCVDDAVLRLVRMGQPDVPVGRKKLVASFIANCIEWRINYLKEMMEYVHIDQWGRCLKNTHGEFWKTRQGPFESAKLNLLEKHPYKFLIAFENIVDNDYITEKIYHGYLSRSIPIFHGDKAVFDLVPSKSSLIYANDYTPKELAELIKRIDSNNTLYSQYFANWDLSKMRKLHEQYCSEHFICATCRKVWEILYNRKCGT